MSGWRDKSYLAGVAAMTLCLAACGGSPSPGGNPTAPSPVSDRDPQPTLSGNPVPQRKLIGVVMNQAGQPVKDCLIVEEDRTAEYAITTDASGRFEVRKPRGTHKITVICKVEKYKSKEVVVEVKDADVAVNITVEEK